MKADRHLLERALAGAVTGFFVLVVTVMLALALAVVAGCSREPGSPRIRVGEPCATCGMAVQKVRFAGLVRGEDEDRQYDSIECLVKDAASAAGRAYLADYDQGGLYAAESLWVVKGDFPTPMGGGLAAFASFESAREVAEQTHGSVIRLADLAREARR
jgi:nitrous oxide reductase accessory protein NosL